MKSTHSKRHLIMWIAVALLAFTALSFCMNFGLYARFSDGKTQNDPTANHVASFSVSVGTDYLTDDILFDGIGPGQTKTHAFEITSRSEVALRCLVRLSSTGNMPLVYSINGVEVTPGDVPKEVAAIAPNESSVILTLSATWPAEMNQLSYLGEIDVVRLSLTVEQVD